MLFHDHHNQGTDNVERRHQNNQHKNDEHQHLFLRQSGKQVAIHLHPVTGPEGWPEQGVNRLGHLVNTIDVVDLDLNAMHRVPQFEEVLGLAQRHQGELGVILVHAGVEHASDRKTTHIGQNARWGEHTQGRRHHDLLAGVDEQMARQFFPEHDAAAGSRGRGGLVLYPCGRWCKECMQILSTYMAA